MSFAAAHASQVRRLEEEEEEMTRYDEADLAEGWEFKIMRSAMGNFGKPDVMRAMLEEEALTGWELLEKLDDRRVRLKRPVSARDRDSMVPPGVDPYRTTYGWSEGLVVVLVIIAIVGVIAAAMAAAAAAGAM
jgi:hypothetical protein